MELRQLRFFLGVADELNFGRAATNMCIAQPALSQHIRRLERELGVPLFDRHARGVRLTPAGSAFYAAAAATIERAEQAAWIARRAATGKTGVLRVGVVPGLCARLLPEVLSRLQVRYPDIQPVLRSLDPLDIDRQLRDGDLAVGVRAGPVEDVDLEWLPIGSEPLVALVPADHPLAQRGSVSVAELGSEPFVLPGRSHSPRLHDNIMRLCHSAGFAPRVVHEVENGGGIALAVACRLGVGLVPEVEALSLADRVASIPLEEPAEVVIISLWMAGQLIPQACAWRALLAESDSCVGLALRSGSLGRVA
jgi:DNA-binding transcriptional LysR family regulator